MDISAGNIFNMDKKENKFSVLEKRKSYFFITQNEDSLSKEVIESIVKNNEAIVYLNLGERERELQK